MGVREANERDRQQDGGTGINELEPAFDRTARHEPLKLLARRRSPALIIRFQNTEHP